MSYNITNDMFDSDVFNQRDDQLDESCLSILVKTDQGSHMWSDKNLSKMYIYPIYQLNKPLISIYMFRLPFPLIPPFTFFCISLT